MCYCYEKMKTVVLWWTFYFYICYFQRAETVQLFKNLATPASAWYTRFVPSVASKTCLLKPEEGPCRDKISMWYFDPKSKNCTRFYWGGCQGNGNRFSSYSECYGSCLTKEGQKTRPRYCSLNFDYGFCFGSVTRWYYDPRWKVCKSTLYSGCGGNKNNFYAKEQCDQICRFGNSPLSSRASEKEADKKVLIINPDPTENNKAKSPLAGNTTEAVTTGVTIVNPTT